MQFNTQYAGTKMKYKKINYEDISPYWDILWPGQLHQPYSSMLMREQNGFYGHDNRIQDKYKWRGWCVFEDHRIQGVMAGHKSADKEYRTRGLWVGEKYRGQGIAQKLFELAEEQAKNECCRWLWSYPRLQALGAYQKAGYESYGPTDRGKWDDCVRAKKDLSIITTTVWNVTESPLENKKWLDEIDLMEDQGVLLGQNEEVRNNFVHITQHWVNDLYCKPLVAVGDKVQPVKEIKGDLKDPLHVL